LGNKKAATAAVLERIEVQDEVGTQSPDESHERDADELNVLINLIQGVTGLDDNQARTFVYFSMATYGLPSLEIFPILTISGPAGTGKTTLLDVLRQISFKPSIQFINGGIVSRAVLRDSFANRQAQTALIDEGDEIDEDLLIARNSKRSSTIEVNRARGEGGYVPRAADVFGATAIHRRQPYKDPAVLSRSIVITTKLSIVSGFSAEVFAQFAPLVERIAKRVDWKRAPEFGGGRILDTWAVGNQQKWDTFVKERSGGNGGVVGLP